MNSNIIKYVDLYKVDMVTFHDKVNLLSMIRTEGIFKHDNHIIMLKLYMYSNSDF